LGGDGVNVLVAYGTTEGQTRRIAERISMQVKGRGHPVELYDSTSSGLDFDAFDAIIVAASVHQKYHQDTVTDFAIAHRDQLKSRPTAFISVSLSAVLEGGRTEAGEYVNYFVTTTGWRPDKVLLLGGALRFSSYDYFQQQIVEHVVIKHRLEGARSDYEFTDWQALASFVDEFLAAIELGRESLQNAS
jgi:menaquinone-dependent protoporphyrinogen oxidase